MENRVVHRETRFSLRKLLVVGLIACSHAVVMPFPESLTIVPFAVLTMFLRFESVQDWILYYVIIGVVVGCMFPVTVQ